MEKPSETPPFWVQPGNTPRPMRRTSGAIVAVLLLLLAAAILLFFAVPSVLSLLVQIFKPNTVKRGWDTLNLVLVLFAIVCGFLGRNSGDAETPVADRSFSTPSQRRHASSASTPRYWFKSPDRTPMLRRNSSSYPELRQDAHWAVAPEDQWRFSDDTLVSQYRVWGYDSDRLRRQPSNREVDGWYFADTPISGRLQDGSPAATPPSQPQMRVTEEKPDDSENGSEKNTEPEAPPHTSRTPPEPRSPAAPATPPSLKVRRRRAKHSFESQPRRDWARNPAKSVSDVGNMEPIAAESPPPPPQQPPSGSGSGSGSRLGQASRKSDRKRVGLSSSSSSTKEFFASLYHQRKRKRKQRQKSVDDLESVLRFSPSTASTTPPPPPPPPPSLFQNLFASKKAKSKRTHSIPPPPSPPPPPPPVRSTINALKHERRGTLAQSDPEPLPEHKPPVWMAESFVSADEGVNSGGESPSPWIPIPPPTPPPPPFRMPELKFAAVGGGDFVRLLSEWSFSSRSASPEPDQSEPEPTEESGSSTAAAAAAFCPSPDVDTKADSFIARFRAGLRLEKVNSVNEKQGLGLSGLGPRPGPDPTP